MAGSKQGKNRGKLELPVTTWQVFGLMLLAGVGLTVLIALGTIRIADEIAGALRSDHGVAHNCPEGGSSMMLRTPNCAPRASAIT